jgi:hypothetical protein
MIDKIASVSRPFKKPAWRPRLMVMLNGPAPGEGAIGALAGLGPALAECYDGVRVRYCVRSGDSALSRSLVEFRGYELVEAVAELSWPVGKAIEEVDWRLGPLREAVAGAGQIRTLIAGEVAPLLDDPAPTFVLMTGTRIAGMSVEEFRHWWLRLHGPLVERYCYPMASYEQLHVDRSLSQQLCRACDVPFRAADAADSVYLADLDAFFSQVGKPDVEKLLREDEMHFSDVTAGGLGMVGSVAFDSDSRA